LAYGRQNLRHLYPDGSSAKFSYRNTLSTYWTAWRCDRASHNRSGAGNKDLSPPEKIIGVITKRSSRPPRGEIQNTRFPRYPGLHLCERSTRANACLSDGQRKYHRRNWQVHWRPLDGNGGGAIVDACGVAEPHGKLVFSGTHSGYRHQPRRGSRDVSLAYDLPPRVSKSSCAVGQITGITSSSENSKARAGKSDAGFSLDVTTAFEPHLKTARWSPSYYLGPAAF
jgi:hypothetical protein